MAETATGDNKVAFSLNKPKKAKDSKPVSKDNKRACKVRRRREAIEEEIALNKEFSDYE